MKKTRKPLIFALTLSIFVAGLLVQAWPALAALIVAQYVDTTVDTTGNRYTYQTLGTGLSGQLQSITIHADMIGSGYSGYPAVSMAEYANSDYTGFITSCELSPATPYSNNIATNVEITIPDYYTNCGAVVDLDPASYYAIRVDPTGDYADFRLRGSATSVYANGQAGVFTGGNPALTTSGALTDVADIYFVFDTTNTPIPPITDTTTRISTITPPHDVDGSNARATSTAFAIESTGYINPDDLRDGLTVEQKWIPNDYDQLASAYCAIGGCYTVYTYDITASGSYSVATTTDIQRVGWYSLKTQIYAPHTVFGIAVPFWNDTLTASSTSFLVATSSDIDLIKRTIASSTTAIITGSDSPTRYCNFADFVSIFDFTNESNILTCLLGVVSGLTVPTGDQVVAIGENLRDSVGTRWPFGYFTRFVELALDPTIATTTLPTLTIGTPDELPYIGGIHGTFDLYGNFMGSTSLIATATSSPSTGSRTLRQIIEPGYNIIVMLLLAIAIVWDMLKIKRNSH